MWTNFRIYQVQQAVEQQCKWIYGSGFPRDMIWWHQILSSPGDPSASNIRCDPIQTASNPYCQPGVTRYSWTDPSLWSSLGTLRSRMVPQIRYPVGVYLSGISGPSMNIGHIWTNWIACMNTVVSVFAPMNGTILRKMSVFGFQDRILSSLRRYKPL